MYFCCILNVTNIYSISLFFFVFSFFDEEVDLLSGFTFLDFKFIIKWKNLKVCVKMMSVVDLKCFHYFLSFVKN